VQANEEGRYESDWCHVGTDCLKLFFARLVFSS